MHKHGRKMRHESLNRPGSFGKAAARQEYLVVEMMETRDPRDEAERREQGGRVWGEKRKERKEEGGREGKRSPR